MSSIFSVFHQIFYLPVFNGLIFLTSIVPGGDLGIAVIILTIVIRFILFPFTHRSIITQVRMKELEPELSEIRNKTKEKEEQARKTMELYKKHSISPFSGCLMVLIQLPILIALFWVFRDSASFDISGLYSFVSAPQHIDTKFLGFIEMTQRSVVFAVLAGATQFMQALLANPPQKGKKFSFFKASSGEDVGKMMTSQMTYIMPVVIFIIALRFSAAVSLYWTTMNTFAIVHEWIVRKKAKKIYDDNGPVGKNSGNNPEPHE